MNSSNILKTKVADYGITQLIQRLGRDCSPLQFVREYCQNSMEAIQRTNQPGKIVVDVNWDFYEGSQTYKLSFTDTGDGMSADEMREHLNNLSSSGHNDNVFENYGVGAKIASLTRNHAGIIYDSWKYGEGNRIFIHYDQNEKSYGIKPFILEDGEFAWSLPLDDAVKPEIIEEHGTRVTLLGDDEAQDTMLPPSNARGGRDSWLYQFINTRYFTISQEIDLKVRVAYYVDRENKRHNFLRGVKGQKNSLDKNKEKNGFVKISDAIVHWWILKRDRSGHGREYINGHSACLNQNELFDLTDGRSNIAPKFGIICGKEDVVLYIEPSKVGYTQNTTRTGLLQQDGSPLPWERWQDEFRDNMPKEIEEFIKERMGDIAEESHAETIRQRLKDIAKFYKISRYRPVEDGAIEADQDSETMGKTGSQLNSDKATSTRKRQGDNPGALNELLMSGLKEGGIKAREVNPDKFPEVIWASLSNGMRAEDEMEDRAATYLIRDNLIKANADFQGYKDIIDYYLKQYDDIENPEPIITSTVREAFEQQLTEIVMGALSLKNRPKWNPDDYERSLSEESLTAAVMPRYFIMNQIKRNLGTSFGSLRKLKASAEDAA